MYVCRSSRLSLPASADDGARGGPRQGPPETAPCWFYADVHSIMKAHLQPQGGCVGGTGRLQGRSHALERHAKHDRAGSHHKRHCKGSHVACGRPVHEEGEKGKKEKKKKKGKRGSVRGRGRGSYRINRMHATGRASCTVTEIMERTLVDRGGGGGFKGKDKRTQKPQASLRFASHSPSRQVVP